MKRILLLAAAVLCLGASSASADIIFSTSGTEANAGSALNLKEGESGSIFVWISTEVDQTLVGISLDVLSSNAEVLEATESIVDNSNGQWLTTEPGETGDLVDDMYGFALPAAGLGTGIATSGPTDFVLFGEVRFDATALGSTDLTFGLGAQGIGDDLGRSLGEGDLVFGTGSVNVAAVPEPGTIGVLGAVGLAFGFYTVRRRKQAAAKA